MGSKRRQRSGYSSLSTLVGNGKGGIGISDGSQTLLSWALERWSARFFQSTSMEPFLTMKRGVGRTIGWVFVASMMRGLQSRVLVSFIVTCFTKSVLYIKKMFEFI